MSLLDDARRMQNGGLLDHWEPVVDHVCCPFCGAIIGATFTSPYRIDGHDDDCPWLSMPKIVAALEGLYQLVFLRLFDRGVSAEELLEEAMPILEAALRGEPT